ncbi:MAG: acyloxyacyl hydrolase [Bacteroidales bacterium]|nr:acyloxyacyl hydrolase [Bacteroidales bacterium]
MNLKRYIEILLYFSGIQTAVASEPVDSALHPRRLFLAIHTQQGSMLNTHESTIIRNYYVGLDFRIGWQTDDFARDIFDGLFRYPQYGIGYYMGNMNRIILGDDEQSGFGKPAALYAFFASPVVRRKPFSVHYDISLGISYNFNAYDPQSRPHNILVGSKNNAYINLRFSTEFALRGYSTLGLSFSFQHFSNGSYQKPNKGINLVSGILSYQLGTYKNHEKSYRRFPIDPYRPVWEWQIFWANGVRMLDTGFDFNQPHKSKRWYCTSVSTAVLLQTSHRRKFGLGFDYFYFDWGRYVIEYRARTEGRAATSRWYNSMALGAYLAHEAGYKKVWFITHLGFYITDHTGDLKQPWIYERVGIKYRITSRFTIGVSIKAHLTKADYTEWTLGYTILKNASRRKLRFRPCRAVDAY